MDFIKIFFSFLFFHQISNSSFLEKFSNTRCNQKPILYKGRVSCNFNQIAQVGDFCDFFCKEGFVLIGNWNTTCVFDLSQNKTVFNNKTPKCKSKKKIFCSDLKSDHLSTTNCSHGNWLGSRCIRKCFDGLRIVGDSRAVCTVRDGVLKWDRNLGVCVATASDSVSDQNCPVLKQSHFISKITCTSKNRIGSKCVFKCINGYGFVGGRVSICLPSKTGNKWSGSYPRCRPKICPSLPPHIDNGGFICSKGNKAKSQCYYKCDNNYYLNGISQIKCYSSRNNFLGFWSHSTPPKCLKCRSDQFFCSSTKHCIDILQICDGKLDCLDGEDEKTCLDGEMMTCGGRQTGNSGFLRSPTLTSGLYSHCTYCNWTIEVSEGFRIKVTFDLLTSFLLDDVINFFYRYIFCHSIWSILDLIVNLMVLLLVIYQLVSKLLMLLIGV